MPIDKTATGTDALVLANVLDTLSAVLRNGVARSVTTVKSNPLDPTPFTGSASGAIENALENMTTLSYSQEEVDVALAAIKHATEYENRVQQATGRVVQIVDTIKPLLVKLMPFLI